MRGSAKRDRRQAFTRLNTTPFWLDAAEPRRFPQLDRDLHVEIAIVGAGITGLTAAYLLAASGHSVAVFDRARVADRDSGHTSGHLTMVCDRRLSSLVRWWGRDRARSVWDAGLTAIERIESIVRGDQIDCGFQYVPGYLHAVDGDSERDGGPKAFEDEATLAIDLGFDAAFVDDMPFIGGPAAAFERQGRIHVSRYLAGLGRAIGQHGGQIFEHSEIESAAPDPRSIRVNDRTVFCDRIVLATHMPIVGLAPKSDTARLQSKLAPYTSYVVAGRIGKGEVPDALLWDTADPYHYCRIEPHANHDVVIFGGEDHKTGQASNTAGCLNRLEEALAGLVPGIEITHRWSGQVIETPDGLPYIGEFASCQFVATGFSGNGLTFGTLSGMMALDWVEGRANEWRSIFDPGRRVTPAGAWIYLKENADYPLYRVRDWLQEGARSVDAVKPGEGLILDYRGQKAAASRDDQGVLSILSAECTHLGCHVAWNDTERTWDCPCHGSRFDTEGRVIAGPATEPLSPVDQSAK
jgi:glycine/D-amino acid oxidase-like deaminating enzyme/nitrite reductase/ring-hydroxylating ferredoxin subunit